MNLFLSIVGCWYLLFGWVLSAEKVEHVEIKEDGIVAEAGASCAVETLDESKGLGSELTQLAQLIEKVERQEQLIAQLNTSLNELTLYGEESGFLENYREQDYFGLVSTKTHENDGFVMLHVMSVRLPSRDALPLDKRKQHGKMIKRRKTRQVHIIVTLTRNGIFNVWDEFQNNIFEYYDESLDCRNLNECIIYSDIQNNPAKEGTWLVVGRKGESWVGVYSVAAWKRVIKTTLDDDNKVFINEPYLDAQITLETVLNVPISDKPMTKIEKDKSDSDSDSDSDSTSLTETENDRNKNEDSVTIASVVAYQHSKRKMIVVAYSNGMIHSFKLTGAESGKYESENKTIVALSQTTKKLEVVYATDYGFRFLKLPKLTKLGKFCRYPDGFDKVNSMAIDSVYPFVLVLTSTNGKMALYNIKKLSKKMCEPLDVLTVDPNSPLRVDTAAGHLLVASSDGLHIYNTSFSARYDTPYLSLIRRFKHDFDNFDETKDNKLGVLIDAFTDVNGKTIVSYAQSAQSQSDYDNENGKSYRMVVLDCNLPVFDEKEEAGAAGWTGIMSKAPLLIGVCGFALFFGFFKKSGKLMGGDFASRSPLGKLTSALAGGGPRNQPPRQFGGNAGGRTVGGQQMRAEQMMARWKNRHPNASYQGRHTFSKNTGLYSDSD